MKRTHALQIHRLFMRSRTLFLPCGREPDGSIRCKRAPSKLQTAIELFEINQHCQWCREQQLNRCDRHGGAYPCSLDNRGWFKLTKGARVIFQPCRTTQAQIDHLFDWHQMHGHEPDAFLKLVREVFQEQLTAT